MRRTIALLVSGLTALAFMMAPTAAGAAATPQGLWGPPTVPPCVAVSGDPCGIADTASYELGVKFQTSAPIYVVGVRFYRTDGGDVVRQPLELRRSQHRFGPAPFPTPS